MFSVVIPLYNKELSIGNTVQSVLNQTYQDYEIVIVNDGSTDNSLQVVEKINDSRIRIINKPNGGVSSARNRGIKESKRDWIAFLDGDDLWEKDHLEEIKKMMHVYPNEKVYVTSFEYSNGSKLFRHPRTTNIFKIDNYFKEAIKERLIWTSIVVVHKSCFNKTGVFNEQLNRGEDLDLWARLACEYSFVKSNKITAVYNLESENKLTIGKSNYNKSILSIIDLRYLKGEERKYFKNILYRRIISDIKSLDIKEIMLLLSKHNLQLFK